MSDFAHKQFDGNLYTFNHLTKKTLAVNFDINADKVVVPVHITFGCHCFTEEFDPKQHSDHHRYSHMHEVRAFDVERYQCSLQLPHVMDSMLTGKIYRSDKSYTYVTQIALPSAGGGQSYSIFFSLEKAKKQVDPAVELYVKSAYLSTLKHSANAQNWRFKALVGKKAGLF